jgi:glycerol kinase
LIGLERGKEIGHMARAALKSSAFQVTDVLQAMDADTKNPFRELRVDGGAAANDMLMQFQADLLGIPVRRPAVLETTALGSAYLAGLATGFWNSTDDLKKYRDDETVFTPKMDRNDAKRRLARWTNAVERSKNWIEKENE